MLASIDLNNQPSVDAQEIEGVAQKRNLPAELESIETTVAQQRPEDVFGLGGLPPEPSRELALFGRHGEHDGSEAGRVEPLSRMGEGQG